MADVITSNNLSTLKLYLDKGLDENSNQIKGVLTLNDVKASATDQNVLDVANAIAEVQKHTVYNIERVDSIGLEPIE